MRKSFPTQILIHSLDSSHMMMTCAVACKGAELKLCRVPRFILDALPCECGRNEQDTERKSFVELYETPILENLLESFEKSFPTLLFRPCLTGETLS
ncbi:hypothetical protein NC651_037281 [Populus alba x Populus x berolinensis]|nr:hypothetical protein NC651_037281 [Populus alba x Populus x berolinensis]